MRVNGNLESLALALSYVKEGSRVLSVLRSKPFPGTQKVGGIQLSLFSRSLEVRFNIVTPHLQVSPLLYPRTL